MHAFEVRQHNVTVEIMVMTAAGVRHDSVRYGISARTIALTGCSEFEHLGFVATWSGYALSRRQRL